MSTVNRSEPMGCEDPGRSQTGLVLHQDTDRLVGEPSNEQVIITEMDTVKGEPSMGQVHGLEAVVRAPAVPSALS